MLATTAKVDPEFAVYIRLAAVTGVRPGEICGLRWADVAGTRSRSSSAAG